MDWETWNTGDALTSAAEYREIDLYAERAALAILEGEPAPEPLTVAANRFGASLGRSGATLDPGLGSMAARNTGPGRL